jgi:hypothetical protein
MSWGTADPLSDRILSHYPLVNIQKTMENHHC